LVRLRLSDGRQTTLTRGSESCTRPRWSPDGERLAFLSSRNALHGHVDDDAKNQLWLMDPTGGEPWPLTECPRGVLHYGWAGPNALLFVAPDEADAAKE